jgi:hypothetical protein
MNGQVMEHIDLKNKLALNFNQQAEVRMHNLCCPLWKVGVTMFTFCRSFKDGKRLYLCSNMKWVEYYVAHKLQDHREHLEYYLPPPDITYGLWGGFKRDKVFDALHYLELGHGLAIYEHYEDHVDQFNFAAHRDNEQMTNFYLANFSFLESFIEEFKIQAFDLIHNDIEKKLIIPTHPLTVEYRSFVSQDKIDNFIKLTKKN